MKTFKIWLVLLVALVLILGPAAPLLADTYTNSLTVSITNNSATTYNNLALLVSLNSSQLASSGYLSSSGLDSNIQEGSSNTPYMPGSSYLGVFESGPFTSYQNRNYSYLLGDSPGQTSFDVVTGNGGYITCSNSSSLNPGSNFSIEVNGFVNTSTGGVDNVSYIIYKNGAAKLYVSSSNVVTATLTGSSGIDQQYTTATSNSLGMDGTTWESQIFTPAVGGTCYQVDIDLRKAGGTGLPTGTMTLQIRTVSGGKPTNTVLATSGALDVSTFTGSFVFYSFTFSTPASLVSGTTYAVVETYSGGDAANYLQWGGSVADGYAGGATVYSTNSGVVPWTGVDPNCADFAFKTYMTSQAIVTVGQSSGVHDYILSLSGGTLTLKDGAVTLGTAAFTGSVASNSNNWLWGLKSPYIISIQVTVSSVQKLWYQPVLIPIGATLIDRSGNSNTGTITWGTNPTGMTITVGGIQPSSAYQMATSAASGAANPFPVPAIPANPGGTSSEPTGAPLYAVFHNAASSMGMATSDVYGVGMIIIATALGFAGMVVSGSPIGFSILFGLTAGMSASTGYVPWLFSALGVAFAIFTGYSWRH